MKLCECSVHRLRFGGILLIVRCSGSRSSFRSFAFAAGCASLPRRWQIGKALFCFGRFGIRRLKGDILFVSAQVFIL
jgi:hypothetical protein